MDIGEWVGLVLVVMILVFLVWWVFGKGAPRDGGSGAGAVRSTIRRTGGTGTKGMRPVLKRGLTGVDDGLVVLQELYVEDGLVVLREPYKESHD